MEFAVNMPEHEPQVGTAVRSIASTCSSLFLSSAASTIASTRSTLRLTSFHTTLPPQNPKTPTRESYDELGYLMILLN